MQELDLLIVGAGSLGIPFGLKAYQKFGKEKNIGLMVSRRGNLYGNMVEKGITMKEGESELHFSQSENLSFFSTDQISSIKLRKDAIIMFTCKTPQLSRLFKECIQSFYESAPDASVLIIQNGINPEHIIVEAAEEIGLKSIEKRLMGAVVLCTGNIADRENPLVSYKAGNIELGSWNMDSLDRKMLDNAFEYLSAASNVSIKEDTHAYRYARYKKAIVNNANIMCSTFGVPLSRLINNTVLNNILREKIRDYLTIMEKLGIKANFNDLWSYLEKVYCEMFPNHYSSMMQDIDKQIIQKRHIETEIQELDMYLAKQAKELGAIVPTTSFLVALFNDFVESYNRLFDQDQNAALNYAKCFINQNAHIIHEKPYFKEARFKTCTPHETLFNESSLISQNFMRLRGEYVHIKK